MLSSECDFVLGCFFPEQNTIIEKQDLDEELPLEKVEEHIQVQIPDGKEVTNTFDELEQDDLGMPIFDNFLKFEVGENDPPQEKVEEKEEP